MLCVILSGPLGHWGLVGAKVRGVRRQFHEVGDVVRCTEALGNPRRSCIGNFTNHNSHNIKVEPIRRIV